MLPDYLNSDTINYKPYNLLVSFNFLHYMPHYIHINM